MTERKAAPPAAQRDRFDRPLVRRVVDVVVGLVLVAGALVPSRPPPGGYVFPDDVDIATCAVAIALAVVLACRRRWPMPVLLITLAASIVMIASGDSMYGWVLALAIAVYEVARQCRRPVAIGAALASAVALGVLVFLDPTDDQRFLRFVGVVAAIGFGAATGDAIQSRRSYVDSLTEQVRLAEESREQEAQRRVAEERLRIARELHDAAAHQIAVINLQAGAASAALASDRVADARAALSTIQASARSVLGEISALLHVLRTEGHDHALPPARGLGDVEALVAEFERSGLRVQLVVPREPPRASEAVGIVAYKVIQEALTNAHKHGLDRHARLELTVEDGRLRIVVSNAAADGSDSGPRGHGITGIRERVDAVGGEVFVDARPRRFVLDVRIPLGRAADA